MFQILTFLRSFLDVKPKALYLNSVDIYVGGFTEKYLIYLQKCILLNELRTFVREESSVKHCHSGQPLTFDPDLTSSNLSWQESPSRGGGVVVVELVIYDTGANLRPSIQNETKLNFAAIRQSVMPERMNKTTMMSNHI